MIRSRRISWIIGLVLFSWLAGINANGAPANDTLVLTQKCIAVGGTYTVYLSKDSLRIESPSMVVFAQAPKWSATILQPKKKIYFQSDYKTSLKLIKAARTPFSTIAESDSLKWRKGKDEKIAGLSTEQWSNASQGASHLKCWVLPNPKFAPQCAEIMATYYGIQSPGNGVPMRFFYTGSINSLMPMLSRHYDTDGRRQEEYRWLDTQAIKNGHASASLFAIPTGFKKTKDYAAVAIDNNTHNVDTEFILKDIRNHPEALFDSR